ncbi:MAG: hypothetical protein WD533_03560 [Dehalococcoidia bacterium]
MKDQVIADFLASLGYEGTAQTAALQVLVEAGLTRRGKARIALNKKPLAEKTLGTRLYRTCTARVCQAGANDASRGRMVVSAGKEHCQVCGGSDNALAVRQMAEAMREADKTRLLVVGGTPAMAKELARLLPPPCEARFVLKDDKRATKEAGQEAGWADVIVIWASTPIAHKTTELYKQYKPITVARRGISALAGEVVTSLARTGAAASGR